MKKNRHSSNRARYERCNGNIRSCCSFKLWKKDFQGSAKETKNSPEVIEAYLGTEE